MPLTVLAVLWLPVLVIPLAVRITPGLGGTLDTIDYLVWAVFTAEYLVKLHLAPARWWFVRHHLIDLLVIAVPVLRPLRLIRLLRLLRLARAGLILTTGLKRARALLTQPSRKALPARRPRNSPSQSQPESSVLEDFAGP